MWIFYLIVHSALSTSPPVITTKYGSISGECVGFFSKSDTHYITTRSTSILKDQDEVTFEFFMGDGKNYERPTINSSTVYRSLLSQQYFSLVFGSRSPQQKAEVNFNGTPDNLFKIEIFVKDAHRPFTVGNSNITYFWGRLPANSSECLYYLTSNTNRNVAFCNTTEMDRCAAPISDYPHLAPFLFKSESGELLTNFAWMCPTGTVCCASECCGWRDRTFENRVLIAGVFIFGFYIGVQIRRGVVDCIKNIFRRCCSRSKKNRSYPKNIPPFSEYLNKGYTDDRLSL